MVIPTDNRWDYWPNILDINKKMFFSVKESRNCSAKARINDLYATCNVAVTFTGFFTHDLPAVSANFVISAITSTVAFKTRLIKQD